VSLQHTEAKKFELPIGAYPRDLPLHDGEPSRMVLETAATTTLTR